MSILDQFLIKNCTAEQSSLIIDCVDNLSTMGLVDIEFNIDELLDRIETLDLFEVVNACYDFIKKFQHMAFDSLEISYNNEDDISGANDLLRYIDQLEDSDKHRLICRIIDESDNAIDALLSLLDKVTHADMGPFYDNVTKVSARFMDRLYKVHKTEADIFEPTQDVVKRLDSRKLERIKNLWSVKEINSIKTYILNGGFNIPVPYFAIKSIVENELKSFKTTGWDKNKVAKKLFEVCLVTDVEWKGIKDAMKLLAKDNFGDDIIYLTELSYSIDNLCIKENINGAF